MRKLNPDQKKTISEFLCNMSVAILTTSTVVPIFSSPNSIFRILGSIVSGSLLSFLFLALSLIMNRKGKK